MDEIVTRAMAKWPNVPHAYGWLALDARGRWLLKGDPIANPGVVEFIGRNYMADARGRWYFQNGPQRVFVQLAIAPWIVHFDGDGRLVTHTGRLAGSVHETWLDESGHVLFLCAIGLGALIDRDLALLAASLQDDAGRPLEDAALDDWTNGRGDDPWLVADGRRVRVGRIDSASLPTRYGFDPDPRPDPGEPEC